jgi:uncharacterized membrane protein
MPVPTIDRSILIEVPIDSVFRFVADYRNTVRYQRQFTSFEPVGETTWGLGLTVDARGRFKGWPIHSRLRVVEFHENQRIVSTAIAGLKSDAEWRFSEEGGGTRVRFRATYACPIPILSGTVRRMLETELVSLTEDALRRLKQLTESECLSSSS